MNGTSLTVPGEIGLIVDATNCEAAQFTSPNPFTTMIIDVYTGI